MIKTSITNPASDKLSWNKLSTVCSDEADLAKAAKHKSTLCENEATIKTFRRLIHKTSKHLALFLLSPPVCEKPLNTTTPMRLSGGAEEMEKPLNTTTPMRLSGGAEEMEKALNTTAPMRLSGGAEEMEKPLNTTTPMRLSGGAEEMALAKWLISRVVLHSVVFIVLLPVKMSEK
ncbi:hypothetical protein WMY93_024682 [Mugilogobius chulae]|uniref:Uncharacterized protein n=1 Tax=Mugilogobius chulae TaxID=88201 RepID=A0AAW0NBC3_9GOBI